MKLCPRGEHGYMAEEKHPLAYFCMICGHREYPAYKDHVADEPDTGARRRMSASSKKAQKEVIVKLIMEGRSNREVRESTGFTATLIANVGKEARRAMNEAEIS